MLRILDRFGDLGGTNTVQAVRKHYRAHDRVLIVTDEQASFTYYGDATGGIPPTVPVYTWNLMRPPGRSRAVRKREPPHVRGTFRRGVPHGAPAGSGQERRLALEPLITNAALLTPPERSGMASGAYRAHTRP